MGGRRAPSPLGRGGEGIPEQSELTRHRMIAALPHSSDVVTGHNPRN